MLQPPFLSAFDPVVSGEGSIDPLSTQATYEHLAERVLPFVTVRMARPRFLTAMAVAAHVCDPYRDEIAADGVTPPWLVFEWYVIEAFIRWGERVFLENAWGIPGIDKVRRAVKTDRRVSAATYLKTPQIFGFSGVYRRLAYGLEMLDGDLEMDEGGWEVLRVWEEEQDLDGFVSGSHGPGAQFRDSLRRSVEMGLARGHTTRQRQTPWEAIARHLEPGAAGPIEAKWIAERLLRTDLRQNPRDPAATEMRREFLLLLEKNGQPVRRQRAETEFLRSLMPTASADLKERLVAIDAYEGLCRPLDGAFRLLLHLSTSKAGVAVDVADFAAVPAAGELAMRVPVATHDLAASFASTPYEGEVRDLVVRYGDVRDAESLYEAIVDHHETAQASKPPDGKRSWFERLNGIVVRPQYLEPTMPVLDDSYVHWYRSGTASTFLQDLRRLPK